MFARRGSLITSENLSNRQIVNIQLLDLTFKAEAAKTWSMINDNESKLVGEKDFTA